IEKHQGVDVARREKQPRRHALKLHGGSMAPLLAQLTSTLDSCSLIVSVRRAKKGPGKQPPPGCLLLQTAAKLFETQSVSSAQIALRSSSLSSWISSSHCKLEERRKKKGTKEADGWSSINMASWRWINTHRVQQAPVGSLQAVPPKARFLNTDSRAFDSKRCPVLIMQACLRVVPPPSPRGPSPRSSSPKDGLLPHGDVGKRKSGQTGNAHRNAGFREEDDSEVPDVAKSPLTYVGVDILEDSPGSFTLYSCPRTFISPASRWPVDPEGGGSIARE
ncbi:hypothetical protein KUCAC02_001065, partial [Chaenocephalus aceratus]